MPMPSVRQRLAKSSLVVIGCVHSEYDARLQVVLQVLADAGELAHHRDAEARQQLAGPYAG